MIDDSKLRKLERRIARLDIRIFGLKKRLAAACKMREDTETLRCVADDEWYNATKKL